MIRSSGGLIGFKWRSDASFLAMNLSSSASVNVCGIIAGDSPLRTCPVSQCRASRRFLTIPEAAVDLELREKRADRAVPAAGKASPSRRRPTRRRGGAALSPGATVAGPGAGPRRRSRAARCAPSEARGPAATTQRHASERAAVAFAVAARVVRRAAASVFAPRPAAFLEPPAGLRFREAHPERQPRQSQPAAPPFRQAPRGGVVEKGERAGESRRARSGTDRSRARPRESPRGPPSAAPGRSGGWPEASTSPRRCARPPPPPVREPRDGRRRESARRATSPWVAKNRAARSARSGSSAQVLFPDADAGAAARDPPARRRDPGPGRRRAGARRR